MKISNFKPRAFTLVETLMSIGAGSLMLAAVLSSGVALQRSLNSVENYSITEADQMRVLDYIAMDCRRALSASIASKTVTVASGTGAAKQNETVTENQLVLTVPLYYNPCNNNVPVVPTLTGGVLTYKLGSGSSAANTACTSVTNTSATIKYYQNGGFFEREVITQKSDGTTSDVITHIARNVATFIATPQDITSSVTCSIFFFPTFKRMPGSGVWRNGATPDNATGIDGDYYVIDTTASDSSTWGSVYYRTNGTYSLLDNIKATLVFCNPFLRNAVARQ